MASSPIPEGRSSSDVMDLSLPLSSMAMVLYNPSQLQNLPLKPSPVGWTTGSSTASSFTCFPKLPAETRLMIYRIELFRPRNIILVGPDVSCENVNPALLFVSQETRGEALKTLHLFDPNPRSSQFLFERHLFDKPVYCNLDRDTLLFKDARRRFVAMSLENFGGVRSIGFHNSYWSRDNIADVDVILGPCLLNKHEPYRMAFSVATVEEVIVILSGWEGKGEIKPELSSTVLKPLSDEIGDSMFKLFKFRLPWDLETDVFTLKIPQSMWTN